MDELRLPIYLDNNATTPLDPRVFEAMRPYFMEEFGNPFSRSHIQGKRARNAVEKAREQVADFCGVLPRDIVFTNGATQGIKIVANRFKGFSAPDSPNGMMLYFSSEHKAVIREAEYWGKASDYQQERNLGVWNCLKVNEDGLPDLVEVEERVREVKELGLKGILWAMYANNETGVVFPIEEIVKISHNYGVGVCSDITQAAGKLPLHLAASNIDIAVLSAHKLYGPKGVGALVVRSGSGGIGQFNSAEEWLGVTEVERGTPNVPAIVGFGEACKLAQKDLAEESTRIQQLRDRLEQGLLEMGKVKINGNPDKRLPNTSNMTFEGINATMLIEALHKHLSFSTGSACTSGSEGPSHVLLAMGLHKDRVASSVRFSLGRFTTEAEIDYTIKKVSEKVNFLREIE